MVQADIELACLSIRPANYCGAPMPDTTERSWEKTRSRQNRIFLLALALVASIGIIFIVGSVAWKEKIGRSDGQSLIFTIGQTVPRSEPALSAPSATTELVASLKQLLTERSNDDLIADVVRDIGIALIISVIVTFSIEKYASDRLREHITYDVLSAAYAKVVPEKIYSQIADNIFRSDTYRRDWKFT